MNIVIKPSIRQQVIFHLSGPLWHPSSTCMLALISVNDSSLYLFNVYSNSFITQATDFYGRNDLDMVRSSIFYYTRMFTNRNLVATVRLVFYFLFSLTEFIL